MIQRKLLTPNDVTDLDAIERRLTDFETRYNHAAKPFKWKFTTTDLNNLLDRLDRHQDAEPPAPPNPEPPDPRQTYRRDH